MKHFLVAVMFLALLSKVYGQDSFYDNNLVSKTEKIPYLISLPEGYNKGSEKKYPILLFLHGGDGSNTKHHPKKYATQSKIDLPFIIVAPHCSSGCSWGRVNFEQLIDEVSDSYNVDENRIYITGYSMGGYGTWSVLIKAPDLFAAAAPICGGGDPDAVCIAKNTAIKAFHAKDDNVIPYAKSVAMIEALNKCGGDATLKTAITGGHGIWPSIFSDPNFYSWLLSNSK